MQHTAFPLQVCAQAHAEELQVCAGNVPEDTGMSSECRKLKWEGLGMLPRSGDGLAEP